jgi:hypothetical protein
MAASPSSRRRRGYVKPNATLVLVGSFALVAAIVIALPTVTLLAVGMVPCVVAYIVDLSPGRYACRCVAWLNFAGVFPYLFKLWNTGHTMGGALKISSDPFAWLVMFSAAGLGWLLFLGVPGAAAAIQSFNAKRTAEQLKDRQRELVEEWGKAVAGVRPAEAAEAAG